MKAIHASELLNMMRLASTYSRLSFCSSSHKKIRNLIRSICPRHLHNIVPQHGALFWLPPHDFIFFLVKILFFKRSLTAISFLWALRSLLLIQSRKVHSIFLPRFFTGPFLSAFEFESKAAMRSSVADEAADAPC